MTIYCPECGTPVYSDNNRLVCSLCGYDPLRDDEADEDFDDEFDETENQK